MKRKSASTAPPQPPTPKIRRTEVPWWDLGNPWQPQPKKDGQR